MSSPNNLQNIPVFDFMTRNVRTISENETMKQASKQMYQNNIGSVIVLGKSDTSERIDETVSSNVTAEKNEIPTGIITERDITRMVGFSAKFFGDMPVSEVMSKPLITASPNTPIKDAVVLMQQKDIRRLPVLNEKGLMVGIITDKDILKALVKTFKKNIKELGLMPEGFDLLGFLGAE
jgi:CBS domain-containing protein